MFEIIGSVFLVLLVHAIAGFKWVPFESGDTIPMNAIPLPETHEKYVGRARHYDEILPAEVNRTCAIIESCGKDIAKYQYEILVSQEICSWQLIDAFANIPKNIVRGGTGVNSEPIFIGRHTQISPFGNDEYEHRIKSILGSEKKSHAFSQREYDITKYVLVCENNNNWIDTSSGNIPNNSISGGKSEDGNNIFVARLKLSCDIIPGQVTPKLGLASATYEHEEIQATYCQVLVGGKNEYSWVSTKDGSIPDYAVVASQDRNGELMYVARINNTVGYITYSMAVVSNTTYSILVKN